jgi:hypothetical protein
VVEPASVIVPESSDGSGLGDGEGARDEDGVGLGEGEGDGDVWAQLARTKAPAIAATDSNMAIFFKISFPPFLTS